MLELNQIHQGDCLDLMRHIPDGSVDMILCDLPYGTTQNKWDAVIPFDQLWAHYERAIKPNGAIVLTASQPFTSALIMSKPKWFKYEWIWDKQSPVGHLNVNRRPMGRHESVLVFSNRTGLYSPQLRPSAQKRFGKKGASQSSNYGAYGDKSREGVGYPHSIIAFPRPNNLSGGGLHPTQKPVALFEYLIRTYTNPGEVVLDNCAGSCTTALAAENTGRRWLCIEREENYVHVGRARLAALQPQLAL